MRRLLGLALVALALMPAVASALPPAQPDQGAWVPDASVNDVVHHGETTYLSGSFNWVGPWTGEGASLAVPAGVRDAGFPLVSGGAILASVPDSLGGVYIGGTFTHVGGQELSYLAHISATGSVLPFNPSPDGAVTSLALSPDDATLYVGGRFATIGGVMRYGLAALNPLSGAVSDGFAPCPAFGSSDATGDQPYPFALAVSASTLYVGGDFDSVAGGPANPTTHVPTCASAITADNVFAVNTGTGSVVAGFTPDPAGEVDALALSPNGATLYIGGQFDSIGIDGEIAKLAAVNATSGTLNTVWAPDIDGDVHALATTGTSVYAGGDFLTAGANAAARAGIAELAGVGATANATSFNAGLMPGDFGQDPTVRALALDNPAAPSRLAIAGDFSTAAGADNLVLADPQTGAVAPGFAPEPGGFVDALAFEDASSLYAGGYFESVGAVRRAGLVALDGYGHPTPVTFAGASVERQIAISPDGSTIYAADGNGVHAWSTKTGAELAWSPTVNGVNAIAVSPDDHEVYLGGTFTTVGGLPRNKLAAVSPTSGAPTSWAPDPDGAIEAIAVSPDSATVYAGGQFQHIGTSVSARSNLAALSAASGDVTPWSPNPNNTVASIIPSADGAHVFVGGAFTAIGTQPQARANLAELTSTTGNPTPFAASASPNGTPSSIVPADNGSVVYIGGSFGSDGFSYPGFVGLDGASGQPLTAWSPFYHADDPPMATIDAAGDTLWAGDAGTELGTELRPYYAQFSTTPGSLTVPTLSGTPRATVALSCVSGGWSNAPAAITDSWQLDGTPITGATSSTFTPSAAQVGHHLSCAETAANPGGNATARSATAAVAAKPVIHHAALTLAVTIAPRRFHAAKGTRLTVKLSSAASLHLTLTRNESGTRSGRRCIAPHRHQRGKRCTRRVRAGSLSWRLKRGNSRLRLLSPRGHRLPAGSYSAKFVAVAGALKSSPVTIRLTVLR